MMTIFAHKTKYLWEIVYYVWISKEEFAMSFIGAWLNCASKSHQNSRRYASTRIHSTILLLLLDRSKTSIIIGLTLTLIFQRLNVCLVGEAVRFGLQRIIANIVPDLYGAFDLLGRENLVDRRHFLAPDVQSILNLLTNQGFSQLFGAEK